MKKRIAIGIIAFVFGVAIALYLAGFFRELIQHIYVFATSNKIRFIGKNFYIYIDPVYYLSFAFATSLLVLSNWGKKYSTIIKNGILFISLFGIMIFIISAFDAHFKIIECTACGNGIRYLHWNEISYWKILGISSLTGILPTLIKFYKK